MNAVIAWHPDRLHRRPIQLERYIDVCDQHSVQNHTAQTGLWDLSTPSGRLMARQLGAVARYESEYKSRSGYAAHTSKSRRAVSARGRPLLRLRGRLHHHLRKRGRRNQATGQGGDRRAIAAVTGVGLERTQGADCEGGTVVLLAHVGTMLVRSRLAKFREHKGKILGQAQWDKIIEPETLNSVRAVLQESGPPHRSQRGTRDPPPPR